MAQAAAAYLASGSGDSEEEEEEGLSGSEEEGAYFDLGPLQGLGPGTEWGSSPEQDVPGGCCARWALAGAHVLFAG